LEIAFEKKWAGTPANKTSLVEDDLRKIP
jgi:lipoate---protein ligase